MGILESESIYNKSINHHSTALSMWEDRSKQYVRKERMVIE